MSPAPTTDLGVEVDGGWPVHKRECPCCNGAKSHAVEVGPPHAPRDYRTPCDGGESCDGRGCDGEGFVRDTDCDCSICVQVVEDMEAHGHA